MQNSELMDELAGASAQSIATNVYVKNTGIMSMQSVMVLREGF